MLGYRHAFHAGNHADVLKHYLLFEVLRYFAEKDKPYWYIDTHAGAGLYDLGGRQASLNAEYCDGIGRLWEAADLPQGLADFVALVRALNRGDRLRRYPGSPLLAARLLREHDAMRLFELHPSDVPGLRAAVRDLGRRVRVAEQDGFDGLLGLLPPPPRRAVVLFDPPYEVKGDYRRVEETLHQALRRFAQGTYLVWYPLLRRGEVQRLRERLRRVPANAWLQVELGVRSAASGGMYGSGLFLVNPPWTLPRLLQAALPELERRLTLDGHGTSSLEFEIP